MRKQRQHDRFISPATGRSDRLCRDHTPPYRRRHDQAIISTCSDPFENNMVRWLTPMFSSGIWDCYRMKTTLLFLHSKGRYILVVVNLLLTIVLMVLSFGYVRPKDCYRFCDAAEGMPCPTGSCRVGEQKAGCTSHLCPIYCHRNTFATPNWFKQKTSSTFGKCFCGLDRTRTCALADVNGAF